MSGLSLSAGEVHVWSVPLGAGPAALAAMLATLSDDERERAERYRHVPSREQYVQARATLRALLGRYLGAKGDELRFAQAAQGKPSLPGCGLHFNVSHTAGLALIAVTREGEVGVDVEYVRAFNHDAFAERYFTPGETASLLAVPEGQRTEVFFHAWTRKEAFLKATGEGLALGLERIEVALVPWEPARLVLLDGCPQRASEWSLSHLSPAEGYVGALATWHQGLRVHCWHWPG